MPSSSEKTAAAVAATLTSLASARLAVASSSLHSCVAFKGTLLQQRPAFVTAKRKLMAGEDGLKTLPIWRGLGDFRTEIRAIQVPYEVTHFWSV